MTESRRFVLPVFAGVGLAAALLVAAASPGAQSASFVSSLLREQRFSSGDTRDLARGEAVVKSLDTPVRRELAHFGIVYIEAPTDRFLERFRDIERFERGPGIPQIGRFRTPPRIEDLDALSLPAPDVTALSKCRPGDCDLKLTTEGIARFQAQDWSAQNAAPQANETIRAVILDLVRGYQAGGDEALGPYADDREPLVVAEQFGELLASGNPVPLPVPDLMRYLQSFPRSRPAGAEEFFYWSMVEFGLKPTVRVNHVVINPLTSRPSGVSHVIAIKQLYASHYFQTTLELRFLVEERRENRPGFYLVSITRSRIDGTGGLKGAILRSIVNRRSRTAVRGYLEHLKRQVERAEPGPS